MKPRRSIDGAAFGRVTLKAMGEAFDQTWVEIAGDFGCTHVENARYGSQKRCCYALKDGSSGMTRYFFQNKDEATTRLDQEGIELQGLEAVRYATRRASASLKPSCVPTSTPRRCRSLAGSFSVGPWRPHYRRPESISA